MAHGMSVALLTDSTIPSMSETNDVLVPVTPSDDTMYRKPSAWDAISWMRPSDVGATIEMSFTP